MSLPIAAVTNRFQLCVEAALFIISSSVGQKSGPAWLRLDLTKSKSRSPTVQALLWMLWGKVPFKIIQVVGRIQSLAGHQPGVSLSFLKPRILLTTVPLHLPMAKVGRVLSMLHISLPSI